MESSGPAARCPLQEQRARWERKRACTARELLETERRYQEQLGLVTTVRGPGTPSRLGREPQGVGGSLPGLWGFLNCPPAIWGLGRLLQVLAAPGGWSL